MNNNQSEWVKLYEELFATVNYNRDPIKDSIPYIRDGHSTQLIQTHHQLWVKGNLNFTNSFTYFLIQKVGLEEVQKYFLGLPEDELNKIRIAGSTLYWDSQVRYFCCYKLIEPWENPNNMAEVESRLFYEWLGTVKHLLCTFEELKEHCNYKTQDEEWHNLLGSELEEDNGWGF